MSSSTNISNAELTNTQIKYQCYDCKTTEGFLLLGAKDGEQCYTCVVCLHNQMLDVSMNLFLENSKEYKGKYYNPNTE